MKIVFRWKSDHNSKVSCLDCALITKSFTTLFKSVKVFVYPLLRIAAATNTKTTTTTTFLWKNVLVENRFNFEYSIYRIYILHHQIDYSCNRLFNLESSYQIWPLRADYEFWLTKISIKWNVHRHDFCVFHSFFEGVVRSLAASKRKKNTGYDFIFVQ